MKNYRINPNTLPKVGDYVIINLNSILFPEINKLYCKNIYKVTNVVNSRGIITIKNLINIKELPFEVGNLVVSKITNKKTIKMLRLLYDYQ